MPIPDLYYAERYRNKGTRTYSNHASYSEAVENYRPDSENEKFAVKLLNLSPEYLNIYLANPSESLLTQYIGQNNVQFCVHPQMMDCNIDDPYLSHYLPLSEQVDNLMVMPSASTRTLFAIDATNPHAVKLHFPFKVSRYTRKMRDEVIEQAINVSLELEKGINKMSTDFAFLREVIGISFKESNTANAITANSIRGENWGFVVRDMQPFPLVAEKRVLIPGFALYGEDYFDPNIRPLLYDLIGSDDPLTFVLDKIMLPIVRHWIESFRHFGYLIEPHGQNVLIELDQGYHIKRIVHRDLSVGIDMRRRRDIGLSSDNLNDYNRMEEGAFHSIAYDRFMGNHFFNRIVDCCIAKFPQLTKLDFTQACQREFTDKFPEYRTYFPKNVWYFSEKCDQFNKPFYENTGMTPEWRPAD